MKKIKRLIVLILSIAISSALVCSFAACGNNSAQNNNQNENQSVDQGDGENENQSDDQGDGENENQSDDQGDGENENQSDDQGDGESGNQGADQGDGENENQSVDQGNGESENQSVDQGNGESENQSVDQGDGESENQSVDQGNGESENQSVDQGDDQTGDTDGEAERVHSYEYDYDWEYHWQVCTDCGDKTAGEAHSYENGACTVCGAKEPEIYVGKTYGVEVDCLEIYNLKNYSDGTTEKEVLTSGSKVEAYSAVFSYPDFVLTFNDETNVTLVLNYDGEEYFVTFTAEYTLEEGAFVFTDCLADKQIEGSAQDMFDRFNFTFDGADISFDYCVGITESVSGAQVEGSTDEETGENANSYGYSVTTYISGKLLDMSAHTHSYETRHGSNKHWQACTVCGYITDEEAHTYENGGCTVCGAIKYVGKTYGISEGSFDVYTITEYSDGTTEKETLTSGSNYDAMVTLLVYPSLTLDFEDESNATLTLKYNFSVIEYTIEISAEYTLKDGNFVFTNVNPENRESTLNMYNFAFDGENVTFVYASTSTSSDVDESGIYVVSVTTYAVGTMYVVKG